MTQPTPVISTTGRAVINPQQRTITYQSEKAETELLDPKLAALRANPFALERIRYYTIGADGVLTMTTRLRQRPRRGGRAVEEELTLPFGFPLLT